MSERFFVVDHVVPGDWDAQLEAAGGTVFHSHAWAEYTLAQRPGITPLYARVLDDSGRPRAMALAFLARPARKLIARFTAQAWTDSRPVAASAEAARALIAGLERHLKRQGALELAIGSYASPGNDPPLEELGYAPTHRFEFELDIQQTDDALAAGMEYKRRKNLKKAQRSDVQIVELDARGVDDLRRMQQASGERIVSRGGPAIGANYAGGRDPVHVLLEQRVGRLIGAAVDGELVSVSLFTRFGPLVYHTLSGHGARALETQAPTLVIWETIRRYREAGAQRFNFGGCSAEAVREDSPEHGVYVYKKAFGAALLECTSGTRVLRPLTHGALTRLRSLTG